MSSGHEIAELSGWRWWIAAAGSAACMAPAAGINAAFQLSGDASGLAAYLQWPLAVGAVLSVVAAGVCPLAARAAFERRRYGQGAMLLVTTVIVVAFNLTNAIGAAALMRDGVAGWRGGVVASAASIRADLERLGAKRAAPFATSNGAAPATLEAELLALRGDLRWGRSRQCEDVTRSDSQEFCRGYFAVRAQLAAAEQVEKLDTQISDLNRQLRTDSPLGITETLDPQAASLNRMLGVFVDLGTDAEARIAVGLALALALAMEALVVAGPLSIAILLGRPAPAKLSPPDPPGDTLGLPTAETVTPTTVSGYPRLRVVTRATSSAATVTKPTTKLKRKSSQPLKSREPQTVMGEFVERHVERIEGERLQSRAAFDAYARLCSGRGEAPPTVTSFGLAMKAAGIEKITTGGRVYYVGLRLKHTGPQLVKPTGD